MTSFREHRIEQHMQGRNDHIRVENEGLKYAIYAFVIILAVGFILLFLRLIQRFRDRPASEI